MNLGSFGLRGELLKQRTVEKLVKLSISPATKVEYMMLRRMFGSLLVECALLLLLE
jgi:hypothetical protein